MSFEDLPKDMRNTPVSTPQLRADLVDLFVSEASRDDGCLLIVLLDEQGLAQDPILVQEVDDSRPVEGARVFFEGLCRFGFPALLFARGRPGGPMLTDADRAWHQLLLDVCRAGGVRLAGAFLATSGEVRPFPAPLELVS